MSEFYDAGVTACPGCGQADAVTAVPAVYLSGRDSVQVQVPARGDEAAHLETRQVTTALAEALAPSPPKDPRNNNVFGAFGMMLLILSTFGAGVAATAPPASEGMIGGGLPGAGTSIYPDMSWLGRLSGFGYLVSASLIATMVIRRIARRNRLSGRARADALWSRAWYCARCATVHFRPGPESPKGPARPLGLGEFRLLVWTAGGYGDLAAKHPVL